MGQCATIDAHVHYRGGSPLPHIYSSIKSFGSKAWPTANDASCRLEKSRLVYKDFLCFSTLDHVWGALDDVNE